MTTVNRTPFRHMKDISTTLRASGRLRWDTLGGDEAVFTSDGKRFAVIRQGIVGSWWDAFGSSAIPLRPLNMTWEEAEAIVWPLYRISIDQLPASQPSHLPKDGDKITIASAVAVVKEGCRQALDEAATRRQSGKVGNYAHVTYVNPWPPRTFIIASPTGRRKYVKLLLKRLGYRNLDKIPTSDKQTPYDLGRSLPDRERENLLAIAPGIVLRDVL